MLSDGKVTTVEKNDSLFKATCGGMGLTGIIINASIKLKKNKFFIH
jgi:FAD/FMN-containing dehydrogenase